MADSGILTAEELSVRGQEIAAAREITLELRGFFRPPIRQALAFGAAQQFGRAIRIVEA